MTDTLSLYAARDSGLHRLHPLTKLSLAGFLLIAGLSQSSVWSGYAAFGLLVLPLAGWARVARRLTGLAWRSVLPFAVSVFLVQGLFWPKGTPLLGIGPLSFKQEGLIFAAASTGRILAVVGSFLLFALTTRPDALMTALTERGLPGSIAYVIVATIQIVPRFQAKAAAILDAQRARGLETQGSLARRARALVPLVAPLILGSLVDVEERALAMEARGFNRPGPKTSFIVIQEARWEGVMRWALAAGMIGLLAVRIWA